MCISLQRESGFRWEPAFMVRGDLQCATAASSCVRPHASGNLPRQASKEPTPRTPAHGKRAWEGWGKSGGWVLEVRHANRVTVSELKLASAAFVLALISPSLPPAPLCGKQKYLLVNPCSPFTRPCTSPFSGCAMRHLRAECGAGGPPQSPLGIQGAST